MKPEHFDALRSRLSRLEALSRAANAADAKIREAAERRHGAVQGELERLARRAVLDDEAGDRYQALIAEREHLGRVLGRAPES